MFPVLASIAVGQVIPQPASMSLHPGEFLLTPHTQIVVTDETRDLGEKLRTFLRPATGYALEISQRGKNSDIALKLDKKLANLGDEGYQLEVKADGITIQAFRPAGVFYGIQTLRQLLPPQILRKAKVEGVRWVVPFVSIEDKPRFGWRGALIDPARHLIPKEGILRFLDTLALHKLNSFHMHLTDDTGWRLEIKKYPKLTEIGAWQPEWLADYDPPKPKQGTRGGFYTQEDIREIVAYARELHINVLPEIEMPGHSGAIVNSYPDVGVPKSNVLNAEESTVRFMQDILDEVMELFPSKFIHIGGDEVDKGPWKNDARTQELMKQRGLKDENELQSWIIRQMDAYLTSKGRRLVGWDEILEGGLAPGATVMSWRGMEGGIASAKAGHDVVMAPTSHTYLDYYQSDPETEPLGFGGFLPLEKVYSFEPIPPDLTAEEAKRVLGIQGQLWGENIPNVRHLEYMAWPRLAAIAEVGWSAAKSEEDFKKRLLVDFQRLDAMGVNYRPLKNDNHNAIGDWRKGQTTGEWKVREWDATGSITAPGTYRVRFAWTHGGQGLFMSSVEILEDGKVVANDMHEGYAGWHSKENLYRLSVPSLKPGARYTLRAKLRTEGDHDSNGEVYVTKE